MALEQVMPFNEDVTELFSYIINHRLTSGEDLSSVLGGGFALAYKRAQLMNREVWPVDAELAFSIWCIWPFKPDVIAEQAAVIIPVRREVFDRFGHGDYDPLEEAVPESTLLLPLETVNLMQRNGSALDLLNLRAIA